MKIMDWLSSRFDTIEERFSKLEDRCKEIFQTSLQGDMKTENIKEKVKDMDNRKRGCNTCLIIVSEGVS